MSSIDKIEVGINSEITLFDEALSSLAANNVFPSLGNALVAFSDQFTTALEDQEKRTTIITALAKYVGEQIGVERAQMLDFGEERRFTAILHIFENIKAIQQEIADQVRRNAAAQTNPQYMQNLREINSIYASIGMGQTPAAAAKGLARIDILEAENTAIAKNQDAATTLSQVFELAGTGMEVSASNLHKAIAKIRSPLEDLALDFYHTIEQIHTNIKTAKLLGLAYDETAASMKAIEDATARAFGLPGVVREEILRNISELQGTQLELANVISSFSGNEELQEMMGSLIEAGQVSIDPSKLSEVVQALTDALGSEKILQPQARIKVLSEELQNLYQGSFNLLDIFSQMGARFPEATDALKNFQAKYLEFLMMSTESDEEMNAKIQAGIILWSQYPQLLADAYSGRLRLNIEEYSALKAIESGLELTKERIKLESNLSKVQIEGFRDIATFGLDNLEKLNTLLFSSYQLTKNEHEARLLEIQTERSLLDVRRQMAGVGQLSEEEYRKRIVDLEIEETLERRLYDIRREHAVQEQTLNTLLEQRMQYLQQINSNYEQRISGLVHVLGDVETLFSKGVIKALLTPAAESFAQRQADILVERLFDQQTGVFASIGEFLGGAGEINKITDPVIEAHVQGISQGAVILEGLYDAAAQRMAAAQGITLPGVPATGTVYERQGIPLAGAVTSGTAAGFVGRLLSKQAFGGRPTTGVNPATMAVIQNTTELEDLNSKLRKEQIQTAIGSLVGTYVGTLIGGRGASAQLGSQIGSMAGEAFGRSVGAPPGVGGGLGGIAGGFIGGLFDTEEKQYSELQLIARNTAEQVSLIENTNRLLDPTRIGFNVPTGFVLPSYTPFNAVAGSGASLVPAYASSNMTGGVSIENTIEVNVVGGVTPEDTGKRVAEAVSEELNRQFRSTGLFVART